MMRVQAIVPVNRRAACKTRLAAVLSPQQRLNLTQRMLAHVLQVLQTSHLIDEIVLLSPERSTVSENVTHRLDDGENLGASIQQCLHLAHQGDAEAMIVVFADLPLLTVGDIVQLVAGLRDHDVVLAPDRHAAGTNAVGLRLPSRFEFAYGEASFGRHLAAATALGRSPAIIRSEGLGADLDRPADLRALERHPGAFTSELATP